ncbi:MAG: hypothetical protein IPH84_13860 [Bacteroidales bacterium]|nr:hypothetical protein [Bacteroidales bacterium]
MKYTLKMLTSRRLYLTILMLGMLLIYQPLTAGWVLTGRYIDQEGKVILQRWFIQDQKVKFEQYDIIYTIDFLTGEIILVDPDLLLYYKSTITDYISDFQLYKMNKLSVLEKEVPVTEQKALDSYKAAIEAFGSPIADCRDSISIREVTDSLKVFGAETDKYMIMVNGLKTEEIWISPFLNVNSEFSWKLYMYYLSLIEASEPKPAYVFSDEYFALLDKGFPIRRIMIRDGYKTETQVNQEEKKEIPAYEFFTPDLCKKVNLKQWLERKQSMRNEYDDYE